jgi:predicted dehydrogenase
MTNHVRIGVIGLGIQGSYHMALFGEGKIKRAEVTAVCDIEPARLAPYAHLKTFTSSEALIRSGAVDAVLIATPHYDHTTIGIDALQHGLHVLVEKPISVHVADAQRLIAAHTDPRLVFAAMFNQRTDPKYIKTRRLIASGELGEIRRVQWTITDWFRPEAYYASGGWRATWRGEGGGVLLNQCPHNLDLLQWICGMPVKMLAFCRFGKYHDIEVEDDVTAYFEYPNGATGVFITTTGEAPGTNRLEIAGDRGKVVLEGGKITFTRTEMPVREFSRVNKATFGRPDVWHIEIPAPAGNGPQHAGITQNFVDAILDAAPLIAQAEEGIHSLELANAMLYSTFLGRAVDLPLDAAGYEAQLKQLIATSRFEKKTVAAGPTDVRTSFGT